MSADEIIDAIDDLSLLEGRHRAVVQFMIESCALITVHLPPVARSALEKARNYWNGLGTQGELEQARIECWQYLDEIGSSTDLRIPGASAVRAVICLLYPSPAQEDLLELAHFFIGLTRNVLDIDREQCRILERVFGDVLTGRSLPA
jgi:hypothetical protein